MKNKPEGPVYRLIHSQEMVQYMWRYTLHTQATQVPSSVIFDEELDFKTLARAVNVEIDIAGNGHAALSVDDFIGFRFPVGARVRIDARNLAFVQEQRSTADPSGLRKNVEMLEIASHGVRKIIL